jgi:hypothetical protein
MRDMQPVGPLVNRARVVRISLPAGAPQLDEWRWVCDNTDHERRRRGRWTTKAKAADGQLHHNLTEHPKIESGP